MKSCGKEYEGFGGLGLVAGEVYQMGRLLRNCPVMDEPRMGSKKDSGIIGKKFLDVSNQTRDGSGVTVPFVKHDMN